MIETRQLLADYAATGSETAFQDLVTRYVALVYSTASRLLDGDSHRAQDVTQTVFLDLARQAGKLSPDAMLGGWLHRHTCFVAAKVVRGERRRRLRERQAVELNAVNAQEARFADIAPVLDEVINQLAEEDRRAVLLRFYERLDLRSVGKALGSTEAAAQKRVSRALDQLHAMLTRRGIALSAAGLAGVLGAEIVTAAPAGLASTIARAVLDRAIGPTGAQSVESRAVSLTNAKFALVTVSGFAVLASLLIAQHQNQTRLRSENQALRDQLAQNAALLAENHGLSNLVMQAGGAGQPVSELLKLRNAVTLRRQAAMERSATNATRIAAIVNGKPIFESEVRERFGSGEGIIRRSFASRPSMIPQKLAEAWTNSLEDLIDRTLVVMDFDRRGLKIPQQQLDDAVAQRNGHETDPESIRNRMILAMMRQNRLSGVVEPTDDEIQRYYDAHQKEFWAEERANLSIVDLKKSQPAEAGGLEAIEAQRREAAKIQAQLGNGAAFVSTAGTDDLKGLKIVQRDNCWYDRSALRAELAGPAFSLPPGGVSDVVETSNDFFIFRVLEKRPAEQRRLEDVQDQIRRDLLKERRQAAEKDWLDNLRSQAVIERFPMREAF